MIHKANLQNFSKYFPKLEGKPAWEIISDLPALISQMIKQIDLDYNVQGSIAVHNSAVIEQGVVMKGPIIVGPKCFIGAHAYLRGGVFLGAAVSVGPGCEIKTSIILDDSSLAHFNFVGDSVIGSRVNMEAGSIIANHHNDRKDKTIWMVIDNEMVKLPITKFGAYVSDESKIGANAVCSPGTFLLPGTVVKRLQLIEQT